MATNVVELQQMGSEKLEEMLEDAQEEMFNLRFRKASGQLENYTRIREVRRDMARYKTILNLREQAVGVAAGQSDIASALSNVEWRGSANYDYTKEGWAVTFQDDSGKDLASALVNLNAKKVTGRRNRGLVEARNPIISYEIG